MENDTLLFLKKQIDNRIVTFNSSRNYYRRKAFVLFISITVLAAFSTVILGINQEFRNESLRIITLIITSLITVISAYNTFFDNKGLWIAYNIALNELYRLKFDIQFHENQVESITETQLLLFKQQYQEIINSLNEQWTNSRKSNM